MGTPLPPSPTVAHTDAPSRSAALRELDPVHVRFGSKAPEPVSASWQCMSASPRKRTNSRRLGMSVLCQKRTFALQQSAALFDHLVGGSRAPSGHARLRFHDRL